MPRKRIKLENEEPPTIDEPHVEVEVTQEETEEEVSVAEKPKAAPVVRVKVLVGSLRWEQGTFSKGDVFKCSPERAARFSPSSVEIL